MKKNRSEFPQSTAFKLMFQQGIIDLLEKKCSCCNQRQSVNLCYVYKEKLPSIIKMQWKMVYRFLVLRVKKLA